MNNQFQVGDRVKGFYKTGVYIGEITDVKPMHYLVKILAVLTHPKQGDLHHPNRADVPFFHERKALAYGEQTNISHRMVKPFDEAVPDYADSLRSALSRLKTDLQNDSSEYAAKSLELIHGLEKEYFLHK
ncbi:kinase-associated lipoprotein B [Bacillus licheniformis]|uniref:kinase-associated lipoprotein B n=1 Tax=Bacillus licheniformis TaxID=1402 RepID=UPI002E231F5A|nr:kinase-associated lipoprotein B [Bacillus licheniformis]